ncbi:hypothetical protein BLA29_012963, partial [Euroglyphus maynei]
LLSFTIISTYLAFHNQLSVLNRNFVILLNDFRRGHPIGVKEMMKLKFIYRQHNILSYNLIFPDKDAWSQALYYYALISIPINVCFMCIIIVEDLPPQTRLLFISVTVIHAFTGLIPFLNTANVSSDFHKIKEHILPMQLQLKRNQHLLIKLKYDDLYQRLLYGRK